MSLLLRRPWSPLIMPFRLSVQRYHALIESGHLTPDDKVELLDGMLVEKMPKGDRHVIVTNRLHRWFLTVVDRSVWTVRKEDPLMLSDSEPEPDLVLARGAVESFERRRPTAADVRLVIEVADSSVRRDREIKAPLYAEERIEEFWLVNVASDQIEMCRGADPATGTFRESTTFGIGQDLRLTLGSDTHVLSLGWLFSEPQ